MNVDAVHLGHEEISYSEGDTLRKELGKFWEIEGVVGELDVYENFQNEVKFDDTIYITSLPFKVNHDALPDSNI